ncbi:hypothetical protein GCM10009551_012060 [Nocardiopsis tropica]|jgi:hypothetical protein|uniref:hypothetical protein n=1 Tax=Nocardiopsis tropica TaxID=109330 RepID=UPI0031CE416B
MTPNTNRSGASYATEARGPVRHYPLVLEGRTVGHLWAAVEEGEDAAGTVMVLTALDTEPRIGAASFWGKRLEQACGAGLTPLEALERLRKEREDPVGGGVPVGARPEEAPSKDALVAWANPGYTPSAGPEGLGGPPRPSQLPRHPGPELVTRQVLKSYPRRTDQPVRYLPVRLGSGTVGLLWASVTGDAAGFVRNLDAQPASSFAEVWWLEEFVRLHERGLGPLEAIREHVGAPENPVGGRLDPADEERTAASTAALEEIARG